MSNDAPAPKRDVVVLGPKTKDGEGVHVLRARDERVEAGELRGLKEGRPVVGEIVTLEPRADNPLVCDVRESFSTSDATPESASRKGPAKVVSRAYRDGWDEIFGSDAAQLPPVPNRNLN